MDKARPDQAWGGRQSELLHDRLTGLPGWALFYDRLSQAMRAAGRENHSLALLIVDVDDWRPAEADQDCRDTVVRIMGERLSDLLRDPDTVGRLGRDEFGVLLAGQTTVEGAAAVAWKVLRAMQPPMIVGGRRVSVRPNVGIALFPQDGSDPDELLRRSDLAMRDAKRTNSGFALFAAVREVRSSVQSALMADLRDCITGDQLVLHYQPQIDLAGGRTLGVEALVRWDHPSLGLIGPDAFMPLVERSGLIAPLTRWVLNRALSQLRSWHDGGFDLTMAVNLSPRSLEGFDIVDTVTELTDTWAVSPDRLTLEITEGALINAGAADVLDRLHHMGERLSVDDYGSGYSALGYLRRLPVYEVKIDKSFVIDLAHSADNATIVRSTVDLGHDLGLKVCAEGVEDAVAQQMLAGYGCDLAQGYFISHPLPAEDLEAWLPTQKAG